MELLLGEDERAFQQRVRTWLAENLNERFTGPEVGRGPSDDRGFDIRLEWERRLGEAGLLGITWPVEYGGLGLTSREEIIFQLEYARAQAPYRVTYQGTGLVGPAILEFGTPEIKRRFLPRILSVDDRWAQGFSEPEAGSDLAAVRTRAERRGAEWIINGSKTWTTFAHHANWLYVLCRTNATASKHRGLSFLLVPMDQAGVEVRPITTMLGTREFNEVFLTDARTEAGLVLGEVDRGWDVVMHLLKRERGTSMLPRSQSVEREVAQMFALAERSGLAAQPRTRADLAQSLVISKVLSSQAIRLVERLLEQGDLGPETSAAKLFATEGHQRIASAALDLLGRRGEVVMPGFALNDWQTLFLGSRAETIYGGTSQIQKGILAERVLGMPRDARA